ncbi:MAG: type II toxin-antitoxin system HicA family toxin [Candidatus Aminicenantes bacterium]|nr:MAG: type II toxin-antitoxin system HicA family toxin [Candidatus Aminicenantes bacterium]
MKRKALMRHLEKNGCMLLREGGNHSVYINRARMKISTVPRHKEIYEFLTKKICKDLEIPYP